MKVTHHGPELFSLFFQLIDQAYILTSSVPHVVVSLIPKTESGGVAEPPVAGGGGGFLVYCVSS